MKRWAGLAKVLVVLIFAAILGGCYYAPAGPYYRVAHDSPQATAPLNLGSRDMTYVLQVNDRTPFGLNRLEKTDNRLYEMGYDRVRREREADFAVDVAFSAISRDNPELRGANVLGGAVLGAATGALIGAAVGEPGAGAAIGAASGGFLGAATPANTPIVRIDLTIHSFTEGTNQSRTAYMDVASVPPYDINVAVDNEVSRMVQMLPRR